eukprot:2375287-Rhodomonas_salina.1
MGVGTESVTRMRERSLMRRKRRAGHERLGHGRDGFKRRRGPVSQPCAYAYLRTQASTDAAYGGTRDGGYGKRSQVQTLRYGPTRAVCDTRY